MEEFEESEFGGVNFESEIANFLGHVGVPSTSHTNTSHTHTHNDNHHSQYNQYQQVNGQSQDRGFPQTSLQRSTGSCQSCEGYRRDLQRLDNEHRLNFQYLKKKIINTDLLIRRFKAKQDDCEAHVKTIDGLKQKLEQATGDSSILSDQLQSTLDGIKPLQEKNADLEAELKKKSVEIDDFQNRLIVEQAYRTQKIALDEETVSLQDKVQALKRQVAAVESKRQKWQVKSNEHEVLCDVLKGENKTCKARVHALAKALLKAQTVINEHWELLDANGLKQGRRPTIIPGRLKSVIRNIQGQPNLGTDDQLADEELNSDDDEDNLEFLFNSSGNSNNDISDATTKTPFAETEAKNVSKNEKKKKITARNQGRNSKDTETSEPPSSVKTAFSEDAAAAMLEAELNEPDFFNGSDFEMSDDDNKDNLKDAKGKSKKADTNQSHVCNNMRNTPIGANMPEIQTSAPQTVDEDTGFSDANMFGSDSLGSSSLNSSSSLSGNGGLRSKTESKVSSDKARRAVDAKKAPPSEMGTVSKVGDELKGKAVKGKLDENSLSADNLGDSDFDLSDDGDDAGESSKMLDTFLMTSANGDEVKKQAETKPTPLRSKQIERSEKLLESNEVALGDNSVPSFERLSIKSTKKGAMKKKTASPKEVKTRSYSQTFASNSLSEDSGSELSSDEDKMKEKKKGKKVGLKNPGNKKAEPSSSKGKTLHRNKISSPKKASFNQFLGESNCHSTLLSENEDDDEDDEGGDVEMPFKFISGDAEQGQVSENKDDDKVTYKKDFLTSLLSFPAIENILSPIPPSPCPSSVSDFNNEGTGLMPFPLTDSSDAESEPETKTASQITDYQKVEKEARQEVVEIDADKEKSSRMIEDNFEKEEMQKEINKGDSVLVKIGSCSDEFNDTKMESDLDKFKSADVISNDSDKLKSADMISENSDKLKSADVISKDTDKAKTDVTADTESTKGNSTERFESHSGETNNSDISESVSVALKTREVDETELDKAKGLAEIATIPSKIKSTAVDNSSEKMKIPEGIESDSDKDKSGGTIEIELGKIKLTGVFENASNMVKITEVIENVSDNIEMVESNENESGETESVESMKRDSGEVKAAEIIKKNEMVNDSGSENMETIKMTERVLDKVTPVSQQITLMNDKISKAETCRTGFGEGTIARSEDSSLESGTSCLETKSESSSSASTECSSSTTSSSASSSVGQGPDRDNLADLAIRSKAVTVPPKSTIKMPSEEVCRGVVMDVQASTNSPPQEVCDDSLNAAITKNSERFVDKKSSNGDMHKAKVCDHSNTNVNNKQQSAELLENSSDTCDINNKKTFSSETLYKTSPGNSVSTVEVEVKSHSSDHESGLDFPSKVSCPKALSSSSKQDLQSKNETLLPNNKLALGSSSTTLNNSSLESESSAVSHNGNKLEQADHVSTDETKESPSQLVDRTVKDNETKMSCERKEGELDMSQSEKKSFSRLSERNKELSVSHVRTDASIGTGTASSKSTEMYLPHSTDCVNQTNELSAETSSQQNLEKFEVVNVSKTNMSQKRNKDNLIFTNVAPTPTQEASRQSTETLNTTNASSANSRLLKKRETVKTANSVSRKTSVSLSEADISSDRQPSDTPSIEAGSSQPQTHQPVSQRDTDISSDRQPSDTPSIEAGSSQPQMHQPVSQRDTDISSDRQPSDTPSIEAGSSQPQTHQPVSQRDTDISSDRQPSDTPSIEAGSCQPQTHQPVSQRDTDISSDRQPSDTPSIEAGSSQPQMHQPVSQRDTDISSDRLPSDTPSIEASSSQPQMHQPVSQRDTDISSDRQPSDTPSIEASSSQPQTHQRLEKTHGILRMETGRRRNSSNRKRSLPKVDQSGDAGQENTVMTQTKPLEGSDRLATLQSLSNAAGDLNIPTSESPASPTGQDNLSNKASVFSMPLSESPASPTGQDNLSTEASVFSMPLSESPASPTGQDNISTEASVFSMPPSESPASPTGHDGLSESNDFSMPPSESPASPTGHDGLSESNDLSMPPSESPASPTGHDGLSESNDFSLPPSESPASPTGHDGLSESNDLSMPPSESPASPTGHDGLCLHQPRIIPRMNQRLVFDGSLSIEELAIQVKALMGTRFGGNSSGEIHSTVPNCHSEKSKTVSTVSQSDSKTSNVTRHRSDEFKNPTPASKSNNMASTMANYCSETTKAPASKSNEDRRPTATSFELDGVPVRNCANESQNSHNSAEQQVRMCNGGFESKDAGGFTDGQLSDSDDDFGLLIDESSDGAETPLLQIKEQGIQSHEPIAEKQRPSTLPLYPSKSSEILESQIKDEGIQSEEKAHEPIAEKQRPSTLPQDPSKSSEIVESINADNRLSSNEAYSENTIKSVDKSMNDNRTRGILQSSNQNSPLLPLAIDTQPPAISEMSKVKGIDECASLPPVMEISENHLASRSSSKSRTASVTPLSSESMKPSLKNDSKEHPAEAEVLLNGGVPDSGEDVKDFPMSPCRSHVGSEMFWKLLKEMETFYRVPPLISPLSPSVSCVEDSNASASKPATGAGVRKTRKRASIEMESPNGDTTLAVTAKRRLPKKTEPSGPDNSQKAGKDDSGDATKSRLRKRAPVKDGVAATKKMKLIPFTGFGSTLEAIKCDLRHFLSGDPPQVDQTRAAICSRGQGGLAAGVWPDLIKATVMHLKICQEDVLSDLLKAEVSSRPPAKLFVTTQEVHLVTLLMSFIKQEQGVAAKDLMEALWNAIFDRTELHLNGRLALCRMFASLCKELGDPSQAKNLLFNTAWCGYLNFPRCFLSVVAAWPFFADLPPQELSEPGVCPVFEFILSHKEKTAGKGVDKGANDDAFFAKMFSILETSCKWKMKTTSVTADKLLKCLSDSIKSSEGEEDVQLNGKAFEAMKGMELLLAYMGSIWTEEHFLKRLVVSVIQQWRFGKEIAQTAARHRVMAIFRILQAVLAGTETFSESVVKLLIGQVFNKAIERKSRIPEVEMALGEALMELVRFDPTRCLALLATWQENNKDIMPNQVLVKLMQVRCLQMATAATTTGAPSTKGKRYPPKPNNAQKAQGNNTNKNKKKKAKKNKNKGR